MKRSVSGDFRRLHVRLAVLLAAFCAGAAFGKTLSAPALPPPEFADTEVSACHPLNQSGEVFADFSANVPDWIYNGKWNLMRLTARGVDVQDEQFEVSVRNAGFVINLK